ncbi:MAG: redox-regulated ATPase YchF [Ardenticatenaceae bacterium]|nr:YchF family ATPase [Anaerolineales bacterium]MCB8922784.1 redox-regulated ATPase YchF [Ardenticatenaceae bacterium]MCB8991917.1 redox-regulated ATPase YchF [Ardenticatenaceae bacterium]MCB9004727.1 redox-regulated ATPase YchF [Ardenticatenaceae bacterium]
MRLGIIGLPQSGKTTVYNALTKGDAPIGHSMGGRFDVLTTVVDVQDQRIDILTEMFNPKKTTYARITYTAVDGLQKGAGESGGMSGELLNHLSGLDGFVHVVRAFESDLVPHPDGSVDAARDLEALDTEFLLNDLNIVERRVEKLENGLQRGAFKNKGEAQKELALFQQLNETLGEERPLRTLQLGDEELKILRGYGLLTLKPTIVLINIGDDQEEISLDYEHPQTIVADLRGKLEMELAQLSRDDDLESLEMFMEEYGVTELSLDRLIRLSYDLMGLQSFFTVGEDEVRAWTVARGATAVEAAAVIHTDLAKGFIRAETVAYDDLIALGSMAAARSAGKLRQEGKIYIMQDGDIISVKFNI